jgi:Na+/melibiose symporter-like transporter
VTAVVADAASFVASALFLSRIRVSEPKIEGPADGTKPRLRDDIGEGLRYVWRHPMLRPIAFCTATSNLFSSIMQAVIVLYAVRTLHWSAGTIGLMFVLGSTGAVIGALMSERWGARLGVGTAIIVAIALGSVGSLMIGLAPRNGAFGWFVAGSFLASLTSVVYNVNQVSVRQAITPHRLQGRMNAAMRFMVWGTMPIGALAGGAIGTAIGLRPTLIIGGLGSLLAVLWVFFSPVRGLQTMPTQVEEQTTPEALEAVQ